MFTGWIIALMLIVAAVPVQAFREEDETSDDTIQAILSADIEQLMQTEVYSVAGVAQTWFKSPAALYVITGTDIRRTGQRTLAEALRLVPGVFVGQSGSSSWIVGMRGFSSGLANKTLVLIDGRTVYDPLFNGTLWDVQDVLLEDVDRIEVIRGPGPTLWGANAVNGVINVVTKNSRDTQGLYISGGGGTHERGFGEVRYGGKINENGWFRVWGKYANRDGFETTTGADANDDWDIGSGGFRLDFEGDDDVDYMLQGNAYNANIAVLTDAGMLDQDRWASGMNLLFRMYKDIPGESG
jgi:iron complex outermembrane receptor protein